jgi:hypothetical protein
MSEADQRAMQEMMLELDMKNTQKLFTTVNQAAFNECVNSFRGRYGNQHQRAAQPAPSTNQAVEGCQAHAFNKLHATDAVSSLTRFLGPV